VFRIPEVDAGALRPGLPAGARFKSTIGSTGKNRRGAGLVEERRRRRGNAGIDRDFFSLGKGERDFNLPVGKKELNQAGADRAEFTRVPLGPGGRSLIGGADFAPVRRFATLLTGAAVFAGLVEAVVQDSGEQEHCAQ